jgi:hypothetical protein
MQGGAVSGNTSLGNGGGVYTAGPAGGGLGGTFTMQGGTIGGNKANTGGGVHVATDGFFAKSLGTIYGAGAVSGSGAANANSADTNNGHAAYAQDGPKERKNTAGLGVSLNSGTGANWEYTPLTAEWTNGNLTTSGQVDWYSVTAGSAGSYQLRWDDYFDGEGAPYLKADIVITATRANGDSVLNESSPGQPRNDNGYNSGDAPSPFELAAVETVNVLVKGKPGENGNPGEHSTGTYTIQCLAVSALSNTWTTGTLALPYAGPNVWRTSTWYRFRPGNAGTYQIQWEDKSDNKDSSFANVMVSVFEEAPGYVIVFNEDKDGYDAPRTITLAAGETVYVQVVGEEKLDSGSYRIRGYQYQSWNDTLTAGQTKWYTFVAGTSGDYTLQWEDAEEKAGSSSYNGKVTVSAYHTGNVPLFEDTIKGYTTNPQTLTLTAGETVTVKVVSTFTGSYTIRYSRD